MEILAEFKKEDAGAGILTHRNPLPAGDIGIGKKKVQDIPGELPGFPVPRRNQGIQDIRLQIIGRGNGKITNGLANLVAVYLAHGSENTQGFSLRLRRTRLCCLKVCWMIFSRSSSRMKTNTIATRKPPPDSSSSSAESQAMTLPKE